MGADGRHVLGLSPGGFHRIAYRVWHAPEPTRTVVCVHGLTGNSRDFDDLGPALVGAGYRAACPDIVGRGDSDWLSDPTVYGLRQYVADMSVLIGRLDVDALDWIGTSMGGLIGMALAALSQSPIRRLVINDIGPFVPTAALQRLGGYVGEDHVFPDLDAAEAFLRDVRAPFGSLTDEQWRRMAERFTRPHDSGGLRAHYDPGVGIPFKETMDRDVDMWSLWDRIDCPVLVLRGARSDLLLPETAEEMMTRGPGADVVEIAGCGHAPALMEPAQIQTVVDWLS